MRVKLSAHVGCSRYDGCRIAISGSGKRQKPAQLSKSKVYPFPFFVRLAKARRGSQTTIERPKDERNRPFAQEESEWTWHHWSHWQEAHYYIKLSTNDALPQLSPGLPLKCDRKRIAKCSQCLTVVVGPEEIAQTP